MNNINLMGPNPAQPFDLQTQQAQLAIQQQIAQAMIQQGMTSPEAVVHTGGNNPYARDIPNFAGITGQLANAMMGPKMLENVSGKQQGLAQEMNRRYQEDIAGVMGNFQPHAQEEPGPPSPGGEPAYSMQPGGGLLGAITSAAKSSDPRIQAMAQALLKNATDLEAKQAWTPGDQTAYMRAGGNPSNIPAMLKRGQFTGQQILAAPEAAQRVYVEKTSPLETVSTATVGADGTKGVPSTVTTPAAAPRPPVPPGAAGAASTIAPTAYNEKGDPKILETPESKASEEATKAAQKEIDEKLPAVQAFQLHAPRLVQVADIIKLVNVGALGPAKQLMTRFAADFGWDPDTIGKINKTQTAQAMLVPTAAHMAKEINASKATQQEFNKMLDTIGAGKDVDPRHMEDMIGNAIADGLSNTAQFNRDVLGRASKTAMGPEGAQKYFAEINFKGPDNPAIDLQGTGQAWVNRGVTTSRPYPKAGSTSKVPSGPNAYGDMTDAEIADLIKAARPTKP